MDRIAVGVLAHVDAGKTTLTEALLYAAGEIRRRGRVDHGDSLLDTDAIERERGITIFSKTARLTAGDICFTLLDTPGHADFSAETERTLQVLDYAVLVISAVDGVQPHTRTLWRLLQKYSVPTFLFINKTDLPCPPREALLEALRSRLGEGFVDFSSPGSPAFFEEAALSSEALLAEWSETGKLGENALKAAICRRELFPCFFGAALKTEGVEAFLAGLKRFTRAPAYPAAFSAQVYKLSEDASGARLTFLKVTGGVLRVREELDPKRGPEGQKVAQIRLYSGEKYVAVDEAPAGTVCAVTGVTFAKPGQRLGEGAFETPPLLAPMLLSDVTPANGDARLLLEKLRVLEREDPTLSVEPAPGGARVCLMGEIQTEVLREVLLSRFGVEASFGEGRVIYKETILSSVEGVGHFEPLRHYAEVHLLLKPGKRDSGLVIRSDCPTDALDKNWQRLILTHLAEKTHVGVLTGAPLTDVEITLVSGRAHLKHTEGGDFRQATYRAVRQGLRKAENALLEPVCAYTLEVPLSALGRALTDAQRFGGETESPETLGETAVLRGKAPAAVLLPYVKEVVRYTKGLGSLTYVFTGYDLCHNADEVIAASGYDPDADAENPADSVFCSHGAGHVVKWNEVERHMHLPSALERRAPAPAGGLSPPETPLFRRVASAKDLFALDKELMQIFERTYGPVRGRADPYNVHTPARTGEGRPNKKSPAPDPRFLGKEYLLVDGYNVIYSWEELRKLSERSMADARDKLVTILCNYRGWRKNEVILVFDAYRVKGDEREIETVSGISVVYTKEAETADTYIEKTSHELAKNHRVRVVTSDGLEQIIILGAGALRVSSEAFLLEIRQAEEEVRALIEENARKG